MRLGILELFTHVGQLSSSILTHISTSFGQHRQDLSRMSANFGRLASRHVAVLLDIFRSILGHTRSREANSTEHAYA